ncbi:hypothetical protein GCM10020000_50680 [Streptomyces olivoverticillatus]
MSKTASIAPEAMTGAKFGWKPLPSVPATQCGGGPGVLVIRVGGEVVPGVDVVVARRDDVRVPGGRIAHQVGYGCGHVGAARHREAAALAEVVLHVDDDQCTVHGADPLRKGLRPPVRINPT